MVNDLIISGEEIQEVWEDRLTRSYYDMLFSNIPFKEFASSLLIGGNTYQLTIYGALCKMSLRSRQRLRRAATFFSLSGLTVINQLLWDAKENPVFSVSEIERYAMEQYLGREDYLIRHYFRVEGYEGAEAYKKFREHWDLLMFNCYSVEALNKSIKERENLFLSRNTFLKNNIDFDEQVWDVKINEVLENIAEIEYAVNEVKDIRRRFRKIHGIKLRVK